MYASDKHGIHPHPQWCLDGFRNVIEECALVELDLTGGQYTWEKSKGSPNWVREKLDRAFASADWWHYFPICKLDVCHTITSDHEPIHLDLMNANISKKEFRFKFENIWLKEKDFHADVSKFWEGLPSTHLLPKLISVSSFMSKWGRQFFHKFREKIKAQKEVINSFMNCTDDAGIKLYFEEKEKLHQLLLQEETYWKQRAKVFWLEEGDSNTKFFHATASMRKKMNHIPSLQNDASEFTSDHDEMCSIVKSYFIDIFSESNVMSDQNHTSEANIITSSQNEELTAKLNFEEFSLAVKEMHPDKASGPDGLNPAFFQHFWQLLGREVFSCCKKWLEDCIFPSDVNNTNLVLIPKKNIVETPRDLRHIALCNVMYKILAKVLANRLKKILPMVISEEQSAFVPGRNIQDNVLVAFELIHYMNRKRQGSEGELALKLDISKAYDRVSWSYLQSRMRLMGFSEVWIKWIMLCVTTVSYSVSFNGTSIGPIQPSRGLRQGDPISPYLFLLCVEGLSNQLKEAASAGTIKGCQISITAPSITHLLFADDSFLFFKATTEETLEVKRILNNYAVCSGQAVNFQKSGIFFSANVRRDKQEELKEILGVHEDLQGSKYLGLPSLVGRSKKGVFKFLKDKVAKKIQEWSTKLLSRAGKAVLIKNVAQAIPAYCMSCFLIPKTLCQEIEKMMNAYWWCSNSAYNKGIRWLAWDKMSMSKMQGGLGFRNLYGFNLALIGKQVWQLATNPGSLVTRLYKARYFADCHILQATKPRGCSYIWEGIWEANESLKNGFRWVLGDGQSIDICKDAWLRAKANHRVEEKDYPVEVARGKVKDLFMQGRKMWDVDKINNWFDQCDASAIFTTRIPQNSTMDRLA